MFLHTLRKKGTKRYPWGTTATNGTIFSKGFSYLNNHVSHKVVWDEYEQWNESTLLRVYRIMDSQIVPRGLLFSTPFSECTFRSSPWKLKTPTKGHKMSCLIDLSAWQRALANRRFRNNCEIVEEPNSSSKNRVRVKFFSLITWSLVFWEGFLTHMGMVLGISEKYTISQLFRKPLIFFKIKLLSNWPSMHKKTCKRSYMVTVPIDVSGINVIL